MSHVANLADSSKMNPSSTTAEATVVRPSRRGWVTFATITICLSAAMLITVWRTGIGSELKRFQIVRGQDNHPMLGFLKSRPVEEPSVSDDVGSVPRPVPAHNLCNSSANVFASSALRKETFRRKHFPPRIIFFTLVHNGFPFIRHHIREFEGLDFPIEWEWHVVEGVCSHDSCAPAQPSYVSSQKTLSDDGTSEYLDSLAMGYPDSVFVHRGCTAWKDRVAMGNSVMDMIQISKEEKEAKRVVVLMQIEPSELWSASQLRDVVALFAAHTNKTAASFHSHFFVAPSLIAANAKAPISWLRAWRFERGMHFLSYSPQLRQFELISSSGQRADKASNVLSATETLAKQLVFTNYAFVLRQQVPIAARESWSNLRQGSALSSDLNELMGTHGTELFEYQDGDHVSLLKAVPPLEFVEYLANYSFKLPGNFKLKPQTILIDGVIYALQGPDGKGISKVWSYLAIELIKILPEPHKVILGRRSPMPTSWNEAQQRGIRVEDTKIPLPSEWGVTTFISTYYTQAPGVPNIMMIHDCIPEHFKWPMVGEFGDKLKSVSQSELFVAVSQSTWRDAVRFYKNQIKDLRRLILTLNRVPPDFSPAPVDAIDAFRKSIGLGPTDRYFLFVGTRYDYKLTANLFEACSRLPPDLRHSIVMVTLGSQQHLEGYERDHVRDLRVQHAGGRPLHELRAAMTGAVAVTYTSNYEGFGLPVAEGLACGTLVVTSETSSMPEVAGPAGILVDPTNPDSVRDGLVVALKMSEEERKQRIAVGLEWVRRFIGWHKTADALAVALFKHSGAVEPST